MFGLLLLRHLIENCVAFNTPPVTGSDSVASLIGLICCEQVRLYQDGLECVASVAGSGLALVSEEEFRLAAHNTPERAEQPSELPPAARNTHVSTLSSQIIQQATRDGGVPAGAALPPGGGPHLPPLPDLPRPQHQTRAPLPQLPGTVHSHTNVYIIHHMMFL